jgi:PAS domain S-box-containing protein
MKPRGLSQRALRGLCDGVSLLLAAVAVRTLVGWGLGSAGWVRTLPGYPPMFPSAALGLAALAAAFGTFGRRRRVAVFGVVIALTVGIALLVGAEPGRSTAVCLTLAAGALLLALGPASSWRWVGTGLLGTAIGTFSLATVVCYASGILADLRFNVVAGLSIQAAVAFVPVGVALVALAYTAESPATALPDWAPLGAGVAALMVTLFAWEVLLTQRRLDLAAATRTQAYAARHDLQRATDALVTALRIVPVSESVVDSGWPATVGRLRAEIGGLTATLQTDDSLNSYAIPATAGDSVELGRALRAALRFPETSRGRVTRDSVLVGLVTARDGSRLLAVAVRRCAEADCAGYVVALLDARRFLQDAFRGAVPGYFVAVSNRGEPLLRSARATATGRSFAQVVSFDVGALHLDIEVWPSQARLALGQPELPDVVAALGLLLSGLLALTFWLTRRSLLRARLEERARLVVALETATDGVWEWDLPSGAGSVSQSLWRRLGYETGPGPTELDLARWRSLIHPDDQRRVQQALDRHLQGEAISFEVEYRIQARDGGWHLIVERGRVAERGPAGRPLVVLGVAADVTERRRADEALARSEQRLRAMFDSAFQFQTLVDLECNCLEANPAALSFAGVTMDAVRGKKLWDTPWWAASEAARERLRQACAEAAAGATVRYESEWVVNGTRSVVDFSIKPILDGEGRVVQLLAEGRDVTDSRRAENAMREMETLSTMGRLAARVAHEVNNPLAGIQNSFLLIKDAVPETHPYYSYVGAIEREISRISAVTRQLYETYRPDPDAAGEAGVQTILSDAVSLLRQVNRASNVAIEVEAAGLPPSLPIAGALIRQAAYNLVQNAIDASPPGGMVRVIATATRRTFTLAVRDQGLGVPVDLREQIFAPFFSTKSGGRTSGMGLGLALVRRSVDALGGRIEISDLPEGGTEFRIDIPLPRLSGPQTGEAQP